MAMVAIRLTDEEKRNWISRSKDAGMSLTDFIKISVDRTRIKPCRISKVDTALLRKLAGIGNNLNQLARWANTYTSMLESGRVIANLIKIDRELQSLRDWADVD